MLVAALVVASIVGSVHGAGAQQSVSPHSDNMTLIANFNNKGEYGQGSDLAFWGNRAVLGSYSPGGFWLMDISNPAAPAPISQFECPGTQSDVSIWRDLVIVSVDSPRGAKKEDGSPVKPEECGAVGATPAENEAGTAWEGIRLVSIANPARPVQIAAVKTDCGSHTHTIVPDEAHGRLLVYILSYPLGAPLPNCNLASHRKISIVEIPLASPQSAKVLGTADVSPNIGCHDVTVFLPRMIAGAACISESQIWDISDPANPKVIAEIKNPRNNIHHSSSFSWNGKVMVLGDELGGAEAAPGCEGQDNGGFGGLWFYDVSDPKNPVEKGRYRIPQQMASALCTAHLFNVIPLRSERNILVSSWYEAGTTVVDFTDPSNPKQIAYYTPADPVDPSIDNSAANMWSAYWYNGQVYANNLSPRGTDIFTLRDPALAAEIRLDHLNPQVQEPLPAPAATPRAASSIGLPTGGSCVRRKGFTLKLRAKRGRRLRSAIVFVGGRRAKVVRGRKLRRAVHLTGLPHGKVRIDVTLRTTKGRRISRSKTYRFC
jgi:hypothetical protein